MPTVNVALPEHPAKYNAGILEAIDAYLPAQGWAIEPFAGVGTGLQLATADRMVVGIEIEPLWAKQAPKSPYGRVETGDALATPFEPRIFDMGFSSPSYGNRMNGPGWHVSQPHKYTYVTYMHCLGQPLSARNLARDEWGPAYRARHWLAWREMARVLKPGAIFVLNIKDHIRGGVRQRVSLWHAMTLLKLGFDITHARQVPSPGMGYGANRFARVPYEWVIRLELAHRPPSEPDDLPPAWLHAAKTRDWQPPDDIDLAHSMPEA